MLHFSLSMSSHSLLSDHLEIYKELTISTFSSPNRFSLHQNLASATTTSKQLSSQHSPLSFVITSNLLVTFDSVIHSLPLKCYHVLPTAIPHAPDFQLPLWTPRPSCPETPVFLGIVSDADSCRSTHLSWAISSTTHWFQLSLTMPTNSEPALEAALGFKLLTWYLYKDVSQIPQIQHAQLRMTHNQIPTTSLPSVPINSTSSSLTVGKQHSWGQSPHLGTCSRTLLWHFFPLSLPNYLLDNFYQITSMVLFLPSKKEGKVTSFEINFSSSYYLIALFAFIIKYCK